jgi:hypothetical protein
LFELLAASSHSYSVTCLGSVNFSAEIMLSLTYFLLPGQTRDVIVHGETGVKVNVFRIEKENFAPLSCELHIFGQSLGEWLAFETAGWNDKKMDIMNAAILWYIEYNNFKNLQLTFTDPRVMYRVDGD